MLTRISRRLITLSLVLAAVAATMTAGLNRAVAATANLAAALQPFVDNHQLAGAVVLVADKDKVLDVEAVGYADIAAGKPMKTDCVFWIASQSKPITAAALMTLVDEGKVKLDDPVEKYLPEFKGQMVVAECGKDGHAKPDTSKKRSQMVFVDRDADYVLLRKPKHPITVRNVLSHTSGMFFASPIEKPTLDLFPLETRVRSYAMLPLQFEPDSENAYANAGINTAGRIIEVVSGMPYEKFLDQRLFQPLGMKDTTFWPKGEQLERLAKSYKPAKGGLEELPIGQLKYPLDDPQRQPMPAGGLFSTAADLSLFYQMLANNGRFTGKRILSEQAVREMQTPQPGNPHYGLGLGTDGDHFGHGGAYSTDSRFEKKSGLILIFLVQHAGWPKGGEKALPTFQKAAHEAFSH
jgi:CubicO group peptidase (beta-lactamase class C family)